MPAIGEAAPAFEGGDQHGTPLSSASHLGQAAVLLVFFPWAFSSTCGGEVRAFRDAHGRFVASGIRVVAVTCDAMFSQRVWSDQERLPFPLLSDHWPHGAIARSYDVFDESLGVAVRGTFLVDRKGVLRWSLVRGIGESRDIGKILSDVTALV
ncbi:MAG: putative peroxiredoxin [Frankiales bacterium]|nr:putative peroxiredoxin [Frankiales bacterium]